MAVNFPTPVPAGEARRIVARSRRIAATETATNRHHAPAIDGKARTAANGEEVLYNTNYATNFTKGLEHNVFGMLQSPQHYELFVEGINQESDTLGVSEGQSWFEENVPSADTSLFSCTIDGLRPAWRGWESPRSGHAYDLEGPDAESLCMAPAPKLTSSELHVEVSEVYALALLRDIPFTRIVDLNDNTVVGSTDVSEIVGSIANMDWFNGNHPPQNDLENRRCEARGTPPDRNTLFRGSAKGAKDGPYISQFLLAGTTGRGDSVAPAACADAPGSVASFNRIDGYIQYGTQIIDQRVAVHQPGVDYMTQWHAWLDVQNGANMKDVDLYLPRRRFITTPRDLATYVHFDQLYQAYFNAALMLESVGASFSLGFPSGVRHAYPKNTTTVKRDSFATFGGPHLLAILTEVSTRGLRAVRRQKFNYHRRGRPEVMGGLATLASSDQADQLGTAKDDAIAMKNAIPDIIKVAIDAHNTEQNTPAKKAQRKFDCDTPEPNWISENLLLPMAFPEGSPMHPSYGAGHATVAGACVTVLKAFFQLRDGDENRLPFQGEVFVPEATDEDNEGQWGATLRALADNEVLDVDQQATKLTIEGELNKLAANIAIGRNMAGVHYYTDYYDSLRLGERIAVGILQEQMSNYPDAVTMTFWDFDDNKIQIASSADVAVMVRVNDAPASDAWWNCSPAASPVPSAQVFAANAASSSGSSATGKITA